MQLIKLASPAYRLHNYTLVETGLSFVTVVSQANAIVLFGQWNLYSKYIRGDLFQYVNSLDGVKIHD